VFTIGYGLYRYESVRYWPSARKIAAERDKVFRALPWIVGGSFAAFLVLRSALIPIVGMGGALVLSIGLPVAVVCGSYRYAAGDQSVRRAAMEGAAFAVAVILVYWLIFILPVPERW
jgi:hypothetical protein